MMKRPTRNPFLMALVLLTSWACLDEPSISGPEGGIPRQRVPKAGAVLDNGCQPASDSIRWFFDWTEVPGASRYHLFVMGPSATFPLIDSEVYGSEFSYWSCGYIIAQNLFGWSWKVRARVNGSWSDWTANRTFDVEPLNTDCPGQSPS
jgi:hypothetical protein